MSNLTQDDLRQLYEAGWKRVKIVRQEKYRAACPEHNPASKEVITSTIYDVHLFEGETLKAALVGYATQLLDEVWPGKKKYIFQFQNDHWGYSGCGSYENSLTALIVDLARMKKERSAEKTYGIGVLPGGGVIATTPESVTAVVQDAVNMAAQFAAIASHPTKTESQAQVEHLKAQLDQLRADVREIAEVLLEMNKYNSSTIPLRLRKVVERG